MARVNLEARVAALEEEITKIKVQFESIDSQNGPWWKTIVGIYQEDPYFEEATRLGREYRESTRPKSRKRKTV